MPGRDDANESNCYLSLVHSSCQLAITGRQAGSQQMLIINITKPKIIDLQAAQGEENVLEQSTWDECDEETAQLKVVCVIAQTT